MTEPEPRFGRPLTDKEEEIAELVARGLSAEDVRAELGHRGRFVSVSTIRSSIREIAHKIQQQDGNPCGLTPVALIRLHVGRTTRAA